MKINTILLTALALVVIAPNVRAEIASKAYVDDTVALKQGNLGGGVNADKVVTATGTAGTVSYTAIDSTPTENSTNLVTSGGVYDMVDGAIGDIQDMESALDNLADAAVSMQQDEEGFLVVDSGTVSVLDGDFITDELINNGAGIQLGKLGFPQPAAICETKGCMLMYYNGKYVWEVVSRDTGETPSTAAGYVSATPTGGGNVSTGEANSVAVSLAGSSGGSGGGNTPQCTTSAQCQNGESCFDGVCLPQK